MMENSEMINSMAMVSSIIRTMIDMKVISEMELKMVEAPTSTTMETDMKDNG